MKKNQKHFNIRKNFTSPLQILRYLGIFIDKWDYGLDLGNKQIIHCNKAITMNGIIFNNKIKPKERNKYRINSKHIDDHMTGKKTFYYTSNPFSRYMLCCPDIDNNTKDKAIIAPFLNMFLSHFPDIFYDRGSSGKSLHPYLKLDMYPLYDYHLFDSNDYRSYPKYANSILSNISNILKIYGHNILAPEHQLVIDNKTGKTKPEYFVELDAIKGTYPDYNFYYNKKASKYVITDVINHGVLVKIPRLITPEDYDLFYSSRVYSILTLISFSFYIGSSLLLSGCVSDEQRMRIEKYLLSFGDVLEAHSVFPPSQAQEKNSVALSLAQAGSDAVLAPRLESRVYNYVYMPGHFCSDKKKPHFQPKNKESVKSINQHSDAGLRSRKYLYYLYEKHILEGKEEPTFEKYRQNYRIDVGTGEEDENDEKRLRYIYDKYLPRIRKYKFGTLKSKIDRLEHHIKNITTQEHINLLRDRYSSFPRNIYPQDVAGAALWFSATLTNEEYLEYKKWTAQHTTELNRNKELTAPMSALEGFLNKLKEKSILKNRCDHKKAKALREILIHLGWIECVDNSYDYIYAHRSMRYVLKEKHPYYKEFEEAIGIETIESWKNRKKQEQKKNTA